MLWSGRKLRLLRFACRESIQTHGPDEEKQFHPELVTVCQSLPVPPARLPCLQSRRCNRNPNRSAFAYQTSIKRPLGSMPFCTNEEATFHDREDATKVPPNL
ncbi:Agmatine deiminase [Anopheles sinensis]|uniref:Agmatine deiminase n=1 Tax=Anopheles sinensis TaxID=74873 RepID=A0A084VX29_ANOSI|nr:Agmatine deiminase [Anopheles sinensis]